MSDRLQHFAVARSALDYAYDLAGRLTDVSIDGAPRAHYVPQADGFFNSGFDDTTADDFYRKINEDRRRRRLSFRKARFRVQGRKIRDLGSRPRTGWKDIEWYDEK